MNYRLTQYVSRLVLFCCALGLLFHARAGSEVVTLEHGGVSRRALVELPDTPPDGPVPLLIALHDVASSGTAMRHATELSRVAQEAGMIAAYPDSHGLVWDSGRSRSGAQPEIAARDDAGFLVALIGQLVERYGADPERVYLAGLGDGGAMAFEVACLAPGSVTALAVVGALLWNTQPEGCLEADTAPSVLMIHGDGDGMGQDLRRTDRPSRVLSTRQTLDFWAARAGCEAEPSESQGAVVYRACRDGAQVALLGVARAGRHWMRPDRILNSTNFSAGEVMDAFFQGRDWRQQVPERASRSGNGPSRSYHVYAPAGYDPAAATPLVVVLHGRPDSGLGIAHITDMNVVADEETFIAVYPDSYESSWNYVAGLPGYPVYSEVDDVAFMRDLVHELELDFKLDRQRLYVTGFSNGGLMTELLACTATDTFAAFAVVGATVVPEMAKPCSDTPAAPILFMHGTHDRSITWDAMRATVAGGEARTAALSAPDSFQFWAIRNGCLTVPEAATLPQRGRSPGTQVHRFVQTGCLSGAEVIFYAIENGGHNWPGVPGRISQEIAGAVNQDFHASEVIWKFFERHSLGN